MPPSKLSLEFKGLVTAPGQLAIPTGALTTALNVNLPAPGVAEKRTGFVKAAYGFGQGAHSFISTPQLGSKVLVNVGTLTSALALGTTDGTAAITYTQLPGGQGANNNVAAKMKMATMNQALYCTSTNATIAVPPDTINGRFAGMPRPPGMQYNGTPLVTKASNGAVADGFAVAYRVTWTLTEYDYSGTNITQQITSAPSGRYVVQNITGTGGYSAGNARDVQLLVQLPFRTNCTINDPSSRLIDSVYWTLRVYRSKGVNVALGTPTDELQLCWQGQPSAGDIAAGFMTVTDSAPDAALGAYLYTNQYSGGDVGTTLVKSTDATEGIATSNDRPPICTDVAAFQGCLFYANTKTPWRKTFSILAVGTAGTVLKAGDTISLLIGATSATLTAVSGAPGANQFKVETGYSTLTDNVRQTAMNLVAAINAASVQTTFGSSSFVATYVGNDASPGAIGKIMLESIRPFLVTTALTVSTSAGAAAFIGLDEAASRDVWPNGIAVSKPLQGDAVPPCNYFQVGRADSAISRVVTLRDALYIFTDDGIWWVRGQDPSNFQLDQFDNSFRLLARDALTVCNDAIYAWGREGIARITNGGVEYIDLPIRDLTQEIVQKLGDSVFAVNSFAVAYRVARRVLFFYRSAAANNAYGCDRALVWNIATQSWTEYDFTGNSKSCGAVRDSDGTMLMGQASAGTDTPIFYETTPSTTTWEDWDPINNKLTAVSVSMTWATSAPLPDGLCRWHECQVYFSPDTTLNYIGIPQQFSLILQTETLADPNTPNVFQYQGSTVNTLQSNRYQVVRVLCEPSVTFAARMNVTILQSTTNPFRLAGWAMLYSPVSNFMVR